MTKKTNLLTANRRRDDANAVFVLPGYASECAVKDALVLLLQPYPVAAQIGLGSRSSFLAFLIQNATSYTGTTRWVP